MWLNGNGERARADGRAEQISDPVTVFRAIALLRALLLSPERLIPRADTSLPKPCKSYASISFPFCLPARCDALPEHLS
jgi:hypothetical protein